MTCSNCGAELPEGTIFCPNCGQEVQVISAVDVLEEEILKEFVDEDQAPASQAQANASATSARKTSAPKTKAKKRKKRTRNVIIVVIVVAAALAVLGYLFYYQNHSPDYLLNKAQQEYDQKEYDEAKETLDKLFAVDPQNEEGLILAGNVSFAIADYPSAEDYFLTAISVDPDSVDAYDGILETYYVQGKIDEIRALKKTVTNEEILALFDKYIPPSPEIKVEGGVYSDYLTVEIRAPKKGLTIYYTLDGTTPTEDSTLYDGPVEIEESGKVTLTAICVDENGIASDPASEEYDISLEAPDMPVADPDGGQFTSQTYVTVTVPAGTTVYYTWDGSTPGEESYVYNGPIPVPEGNNILSLVAIDSYGMSSEVLRCNFVYYPQTTSQTIESAPQEEYVEESTGQIEGEGDFYDYETDEEWYGDTEDYSYSEEEQSGEEN